jgi:hypothetical protein
LKLIFKENSLKKIGDEKTQKTLNIHHFEIKINIAIW